MTYRGGELDQRVTIRSRTRAPDGAGGFSEHWSDVATVWALVRPMSGRERENADRQEASANYLIVVRYRSDVKESDSIYWRGNEYNIRFIKDRGPRALYLEMEAERGVAS